MQYYADAFACVSFTEKLFQSDLPAENVFVARKIRTIPPLQTWLKLTFRLFLNQIHVSRNKTHSNKGDTIHNSAVCVCLEENLVALKGIYQFTHKYFSSATGSLICAVLPMCWWSDSILAGTPQTVPAHVLLDLPISLLEHGRHRNRGACVCVWAFCIQSVCCWNAGTAKTTCWEKQERWGLALMEKGKTSKHAGKSMSKQRAQKL